MSYLNNNKVSPQASEGQPLSEQARVIFETVNYVFLCNIFALFGIVGNNINIIVFYKQGLTSSINISFLSLAISDLCSLVTLLWFNVLANPLFKNADIPMVPSEFEHLSGGSLHSWFARITCMITAYVTAERCLCITLPLKIKQIITPRRAALIIYFIYILHITALVPEYVAFYIDWKFYPETNKTLLGLVPTALYDKASGITFLLFGVYILVSFSALIIFTITLIVKLRQKTKWRKESTHDNKQSDTLSSRDPKSINMVIVIASVLIVCYMPAVVFSVVIYIVPGLYVVGKYSNLFFVTWSFVFALDSFNSSVSILLYYKMSSKYRTTFPDLFPICSTSKRQET